MTIQEAKEFFISRIVKQAQLERRPLAKLEREILYFTETGTGATPHMLMVSAQFDEQNDLEAREEYEAKIIDLLNAAYAREKAPEVYREAYEKLRTEDHYVLVMVDQSIVATLAPPLPLPIEPKPRDRWWWLKNWWKF